MMARANQLGLCGVLAVCAACGAPESGEPIEQVLQEVQAASITKFVSYVQSSTRVARATGAIFAPFRDGAGNPETIQGIPLRGSCGITFISPHYAVTAAHCVDSDQVQNPATDTVMVETYDISGMTSLELAFAASVSGRWPGFNSLMPLQNNDDYLVQSLSCKVVSRCSFGSHACTFSADVALVHCPSRPHTADWMPIAPSDPLTGPVEMYWAHEVYNIPFAAPTPPPAGSSPSTVKAYEDALDRYNHYTPYSSANRDQNYHYLGGGKNQLLPLKSKNFPSSQGGVSPRRLSGGDSIGQLVFTDLFGCHGTSGSGVFQRNAAGELEFLGPVATGSNWAGNSLCVNGLTHAPGAPSISYSANASSRRLFSDNAALLNNDRTFTEATIAPSADIERSFGPVGPSDTEGGTSIALSAGNAGVSFAVLKFDNIASGLSTVVHQAVLKVYVETADVRIQVRDAAGNVIADPAGPYSVGLRTYDITSLVQKWKNNTEPAKYVTLHYANSVLGATSIRAREFSGTASDPSLFLATSP